jgi:hypothetical protein
VHSDIKSVARISKRDNDAVELRLLNGEWTNDNSMWCIVDENEKINAVVPIDTLVSLYKNISNINQENFNLKLEKAIWQSFPADFDDVWAVAIDELARLSKDNNSTIATINIEKLLNRIQDKYPNLFLDPSKFIIEVG